MKKQNDEIKNGSGPEELDDDMLDTVSGGFMRFISLSSNRYVFINGTVCKHCGNREGEYENSRMRCVQCQKNMIDRKVSDDEIKQDGGGLI